MINCWRFSSSISKVWARGPGTPLPTWICLLRDVSRSELVDFVLLIVLTFPPSWVTATPLWGSLRVRRLRSSRAIFSNVVPFFRGDGGGWGACAVCGDAGSGLLLVVELLRLPRLLLVEGRSPSPKLTPESARRSLRRYSWLLGSRLSGPAISWHCSITLLAVRRYLSTLSRTAVQPLASLGPLPWVSRFLRTFLPFFSTAVM